MAVVSPQRLIRCKCGYELTRLRKIDDPAHDIGFFIQRCDHCQELNVVREDGVQVSAS